MNYDRELLPVLLLYLSDLTPSNFYASTRTFVTEIDEDYILNHKSDVLTNNFSEYFYQG